MLAAGTDLRAMFATGIAVAIGVTVTMLAALGWAIRSDVAEEGRLDRQERTRRLSRTVRRSSSRAA
jgi:hypothetical protein